MTNDLIKKEADYQWIKADFWLRLNAQNAHMTSHSIEEQIARAKRALSLRQMTHLSRQKFEKRFGISTSTLQHWEDPKKNGLTLKGAKRLIQILQQSGIYCSVEWLMHRIGPGPQTLPTHAESHRAKPTHRVSEISEAEHIASELALFTQHYPEVIHTVVSDNSMEPRFSAGEHVAGIRRYRQGITSLVGQDCIVVTKEGQLLVRRIRAEDAPGFYHLSCLNMDASIAKPVLYHVELVSAAPIIWSRRMHN